MYIRPQFINVTFFGPSLYELCDWQIRDTYPGSDHNYISFTLSMESADDYEFAKLAQYSG